MGNLVNRGNSPTATPETVTKREASKANGRDLYLQPITFEEFGEKFENE
jgi:hypothetical protein